MKSGVIETRFYIDGPSLMADIKYHTIDGNKREEHSKTIVAGTIGDELSLKVNEIALGLIRNK